ncbi:MAG: PEGA domain-containing protein [Planctomycetes bacterium]|nr:PEGA domain-containing protein [Planctomycetota bacterium]
MYSVDNKRYLDEIDVGEVFQQWKEALEQSVARTDLGEPRNSTRQVENKSEATHQKSNITKWIVSLGDWVNSEPVNCFSVREEASKMAKTIPAKEMSRATTHGVNALLDTNIVKNKRLASDSNKYPMRRNLFIVTMSVFVLIVLFLLLSYIKGQQGGMPIERVIPPERLEVIVDGSAKLSGNVSPYVIRNLNPGDHIITLAPEGYGTKQVKTVLEDGESEETEPNNITRLPLMAVEAKAMKVNHSTLSKRGETFEKSDSLISKLDIASMENDKKKGTLSVQTLPWSRVYIDGKFIKNTPVINHNLEPGSYVVTVENPVFSLKESFNISIKQGKTTKLIKKLI